MKKLLLIVLLFLAIFISTWNTKGLKADIPDTENENYTISGMYSSSENIQVTITNTRINNATWGYSLIDFTANLTNISDKYIYVRHVIPFVYSGPVGISGGVNLLPHGYPYHWDNSTNKFIMTNYSSGNLGTAFWTLISSTKTSTIMGIVSRNKYPEHINKFTAASNQVLLDNDITESNWRYTFREDDIYASTDTMEEINIGLLAPGESVSYVYQLKIYKPVASGNFINIGTPGYNTIENRLEKIATSNIKETYQLENGDIIKENIEEIPVGQAYSKSYQEIAGYELIEIQGDISGTLGFNPIEIKYILKKIESQKGLLNIKYITENNNILKEYSLTDFLNNDYIVDYEPIPGYKLIKVIGNSTGVYTLETQSLTFVLVKEDINISITKLPQTGNSQLILVGSLFILTGFFVVTMYLKKKHI